jgi:phosphate butyryltransferase
MSPNAAFELPEVSSFKQIYERARQLAESGKKTRAALVVPSDSSALKAFARGMRDGLVEATIVGDETLAKERAREAGVDIGSAKFLDIREPVLAVQTAAKMVAAGELDLIVKGRISTVSFLRLLFDKEGEFNPSGNRISHVTVMHPALYSKLLLLTDAAVNIEPDLRQKLALINNAVQVATSIGIKKPRVAVLAAVEVVYPQMPVTTDAAIIAKMADRHQIKNAYVDGPLSFDTAVDKEAAEAKGITHSPVAGQADILLAPNIETANGVYKAMTLYGNAEIGGLVWGGRVPVVVSSRCDSTENRFNALLLGILTANR